MTMNYSLIPVPFSLVLIILYMIARNRNNLKMIKVTQPALTFLAIIIAVLSYLSPNVNPGYTTWILVGLGLCWLGDIFNIDMSNDRILFAAMVVFFIAYLEYAIAFTLFSGFQSQDIIVGVVALLIYLFLARLYWKGLGDFRAPVLIFLLVVIFMVTRAISTLFGGSFSQVSAWMVAIGATLVAMGDIEYGIRRFYKPMNFQLGPLYYAGGQVLIALSCTYFFMS